MGNKHKNKPRGAAGFQDFSFRRKPIPPPQKAMPTFTVGDVQPKPGWCLVEQVQPPKPEDDDQRIVTRGGAVAPDGQKVVIQMRKTTTADARAQMQDETYRIIATGSDFIPNGDSPEPFPFVAGDEVIVSVHGATTAHGLKYPDDKGDDDPRPTRLLVQMMYVIGRITRAEHMREVHGDG